MNQTKLYRFFAFSWVAGAIWIVFAYAAETAGPTVCLIRKVTTFPCPSCGATRGVVMLMHGNIAGAILMNPLSVILALITAGIPLLMLYDLIRGTRVLWHTWQAIEGFMSRRAIALPLIALILCNWIWNIIKGL